MPLTRLFAIFTRGLGYFGVVVVVFERVVAVVVVIVVIVSFQPKNVTKRSVHPSIGNLAGQHR